MTKPSQGEPTLNNHKTYLGFWIYLMTDCVLFASIFATYIVLHGSSEAKTFTRDLFDLSFVLTETIILLLSSLSAGIALLCAREKKSEGTVLWLGVTIALGVTFLGLELSEFYQLSAEGYGWAHYSSLSAFFTLVGLHGAHIAVGLIWALVLVVLVSKNKLQPFIFKRLSLFTMFWHFLDIIWVFIFSIVYLMGVI